MSPARDIQVYFIYCFLLVRSAKTQDLKTGHNYSYLSWRYSEFLLNGFCVIAKCVVYTVQFFTSIVIDCLTVSWMELYALHPPCCFYKLTDDSISWYRVTKEIRGDGVWRQRWVQ